PFRAVFAGVDFGRRTLQQVVNHLVRSHSIFKEHRTLLQHNERSMFVDWLEFKMLLIELARRVKLLLHFLDDMRVRLLSEPTTGFFYQILSFTLDIGSQAD